MIWYYFNSLNKYYKILLLNLLFKLIHFKFSVLLNLLMNKTNIQNLKNNLNKNIKYQLIYLLMN